MEGEGGGGEMGWSGCMSECVSECVKGQVYTCTAVPLS